MIVDLKCPIELRGYQIIYDDIGSPIAGVDLFNLSDDTITGYDAIFHCEYTQGGSSFDTSLNVGDISIEGGLSFKLLLPLEVLKADRIEMYFSRISFENGREWTTKETRDLVDISELKTLSGDELDRLRQVAGEDAVLYPETQDRFWRCVCGRINSLDDDECFRCRREREYVLTELNRKTINQSDSEAAKREKRKKRAAKRRARYETESRVYLVFLIAATVLFLMLFVYFGTVMPKYK